MVSLLVEQVAAAGFCAFALLEYTVEDEILAWKLRLVWVVVTLSAVLLAHRREQRLLEDERREFEAAARKRQAAATATPEVPSPAAEAPSVSNLTEVSNVSLLNTTANESVVSLPESTVEEASLPSVTASKRKSFVKRTASTLFSPLRSRSSRSLKKTATTTAPSTANVSLVSQSEAEVSDIASSFKSIVATPASTSIPPSAFDAASPAPTQTKVSKPKGPPTLDAFGFGPDATAPPESFVYVRKNHWGYLGHLDSNQTDVLNKFRALNFTCTESQGPNPTFRIDDETLLRFLRARKFDIEKARRMFESHLAWRDKFIPSKITPNDISSVLGSGLARFGPYSKDGLPSTIIKVEFYDPSKFDGDVDLFTRYVAFFFERAVTRLPKNADKGLLFFDMKGWSLRRHATRFSLKLIAELINIIQAHNPERLEKCILFNTPIMFSGTWSLIKGLLDPVVADKVMFVSDTAAVLELFDKEELPIEYGGARTMPYPIEGFAELHTAKSQ